LAAVKCVGAGKFLQELLIKIRPHASAVSYNYINIEELENT